MPNLRAFALLVVAVLALASCAPAPRNSTAQNDTTENPLRGGGGGGGY